MEGFWSQIFGNGQPTYLVLSDVTLMEFETLIGGRVPLSEYEAHEFDRLSEANISDPAKRALARGFVDRVTTAVSDAQVARDFGVLASNLRLPLTIMSARDTTSSLVSSMNTILLGSWRREQCYDRNRSGELPRQPAGAGVRCFGDFHDFPLVLPILTRPASPEPMIFSASAVIAILRQEPRPTHRTVPCVNLFYNRV